MTESRVTFKDRLAAALVALVITTGLSACSGPAASTERLSTASAEPTYRGAVPEFSGPWAADFAEAYRSTASETVRRILAKGSITDQDYAAVSSAYVTCMADRGYTVEIDGPAGEATISGGPAGGDALAVDATCNGDMAVISALRNDILRNPQHRDEDTIVAACLVRRGLAPRTYTAKDYASDLQSQEFPFGTSARGFAECTSDPLGLVSGG